MNNDSVSLSNLISECCNAFTINNGNVIYCTNCNKELHKIENEDVTIGVSYNPNPEIVSTINVSSSFIQTAKRLAKDETCMLTEKLCCKCKNKCRFLRDNSGKPVYVCSNCREVQNEI